MGLNFSELIVILIIVLILFGPGKLPEIGRALGRGIREFKKAQKEALDGDDDPEKPAAPLPRNSDEASKPENPNPPVTKI